VIQPTTSLPRELRRRRQLPSSARALFENFYKVAFVAIHLAAVLAFLVEPTADVLTLCAALYFVRMFGITAGYHRYFAHRSYKTSRLFQFVLALIGCSAGQKGPLWWAATHRAHHRHSDTESDPHSPVRHGLLWSHLGWILCQAPDAHDPDFVRDLAKYPELRWLDRLQWVPPSCLMAACFAAAGWGGVLWGFCVSTVALYHGTFLVNSVCHLLGSRPYETPDGSRNNALVAILTLGEGWHNNHHHYQSSVRQGFRWWQLDVSYCVLRILGLIGLVWDLREPPADKRVTSGG
jgi:stearoyl-CoA desaturase (delta-9 desaturase)